MVMALDGLKVWFLSLDRVNVVGLRFFNVLRMSPMQEMRCYMTRSSCFLALPCTISYSALPNSFDRSWLSFFATLPWRYCRLLVLCDVYPQQGPLFAGNGMTLFTVRFALILYCGLAFQSLLVTWWTNGLTFSNCTFAHTIFMCFVFIWEQTATCATYSMNWLVFITEM